MSFNLLAIAWVVAGAWFLAGTFLIAGKSRGFAWDTLALTAWLWVLFPLFLFADGKLTWGTAVAAMIGAPVVAAAVVLRNLAIDYWYRTRRL